MWVLCENFLKSATDENHTRSKARELNVGEFAKSGKQQQRKNKRRKHKYRWRKIRNKKKILKKEKSTRKRSFFLCQRTCDPCVVVCRRNWACEFYYFFFLLFFNFFCIVTSNSNCETSCRQKERQLQLVFVLFSFLFSSLSLLSGDLFGRSLGKYKVKVSLESQYSKELFVACCFIHWMCVVCSEMFKIEFDRHAKETKFKLKINCSDSFGLKNVRKVWMSGCENWSLKLQPNRRRNDQKKEKIIGKQKAHTRIEIHFHNFISYRIFLSSLFFFFLNVQNAYEIFQKRIEAKIAFCIERVLFVRSLLVQQWSIDDFLYLANRLKYKTHCKWSHIDRLVNWKRSEHDANVQRVKLVNFTFAICFVAFQTFCGRCGSHAFHTSNAHSHSLGRRFKLHSQSQFSS